MSARTMLNPTYVRLEAGRSLRNVRYSVFTLALPVIMLLVFGGTAKGEVDRATGVSWTALIMVQMAAYGGMLAALSQAMSISTERQLGWNRQLRLTPLGGTGYLAAKVATALALAVPAVLIVFLAGRVVLGVDLSAGQWAEAALLLWAGVVPFAFLGVLLGLVAKPSFAQPLFMLVFFGLAILGGLWMPLSTMPGWVTTVAHGVPTYWLDRLGQSAVGQHMALGAPALVLLAWTAGLAALVAWRYRREGARG